MNSGQQLLANIATAMSDGYGFIAAAAMHALLRETGYGIGRHSLAAGMIWVP